VRGREGGGPRGASNMHPPSSSSLVHKPWEVIIKERLKAKTKIISKVDILINGGTSMYASSVKNVIFLEMFSLNVSSNSE
jgi:hypothetical protein